MTDSALFLMGRFQEIAEQIHAVGFSPETARILTVFNPGPKPFAGSVAFAVSMSWPAARPLPPIRIVDPLTKATCAHRIDDLQCHGGRIAFSLVFTAAVPASGYHAYIAEYAAVAGPPLPDGSISIDCLVVETLPGAGSLPLIHSFG